MNGSAALDAALAALAPLEAAALALAALPLGPSATSALLETTLRTATTTCHVILRFWVWPENRKDLERRPLL